MKKFLLLLLCLSLVGCATGYQRQGLTGGYADMKIQDDIFKVSFRGNAYCYQGRAEDFVLLRSAEVALENGYKYFIIIDGKSSTDTQAYTTPITSNTQGMVNMYGNQGSYSGTTYYSGGQTYIFHKPSTSNTIKCFKEKPENIPAMLYDAEQIAKNIKEQYGIKEELGKK